MEGKEAIEANRNAEMTTEAAEYLLRLKAKKEMGQLAEEFFTTPYWTKLFAPFFEGEKNRARQQRRVNLENHPMLAVWSSWEDAFHQIEEAVRKTAEDAKIDVSQPLPTDETASVEQI